VPFTYTNRKGDTYTLHRQEARLKSGQTRVLHFFSRDVRPTAIDALPDGYAVSEAPTGMPVLKKVR
jgi:hypothetical protein